MSTTTASPGGRQAADKIRALILSGDVAPGQRLVEAEVANLVDASRGAVRAALAQLDHEGLVERVANLGARVRVVSLEEAIAITEVRMAVEGLCAAKAAENVTEPDVAELRDIGCRMQEAVRSGEVMLYSQLNASLHDRIRELSGQPVASEVLTGLLARNVRHQFRLALQPGRLQVSLPEHLAIIDEVCSGSPDGAERAIRRHIASVIEALRQSTRPTPA